MARLHLGGHRRGCQWKMQDRLADRVLTAEEWGIRPARPMDTWIRFALTVGMDSGTQPDAAWARLPHRTERLIDQMFHATVSISLVDGKTVQF